MTTTEERRSGTRHLVADVIRRPVIRRLVVVFACFRAVEMGSWIAVTTVAYELGGVGQASAVLVAQLAPAAFAATMVGTLAERWGWVRTLAGGLALQAVALAAVAVLIVTEAPPLAIYAAAIVSAIVSVTARPTIATLLPRAARSPRELTAANAVIGWADGLASLVGPVITAVSIGLAGLSAPFVIFAVIAAVASVIAFGLTAQINAPRAEPDEPRTPFREAFTIAVRSRGSRSTLVILGAHSFVVGALDLLFVVIAIDVLGGRSADAGWMSVAFGVGALVGGAASMLLVARRELWPAIVGSALVMSAALAAIGFGETPWTAALILGAVGVGAGVMLVATRTLLQRVADLRVLCHTFAVAESSQMLMLLAGALAVPLLVRWFTAEWAGVGVAVVMLIALVATTRSLAESERAVRAPVERIELLAQAPVFGLLPAPSLETVARHAEPKRVHAGEVVIAEGDVGDEFYVVESGELSVHVAGRVVATLCRGQGFGELALLHDIPRTATVVAISDADLLSVDRETFLVALAGSAAGFTPDYELPIQLR